MAPSDCWLPSPKSTVTSLTFAVLPTPIVNVAGCPAFTEVVGPEIVTPVRGFSPTVTSAVFPATLAVTLAVRDVFRTVCALPSASVVDDDADNVPLSVVNVTGMPARPEPDPSSTCAVIVELPPTGPSVCGLALITTRSTAALPTLRFSSLPDAPPENAVTVAVPLWLLVMSLTRTWPLLVRASLGSIRPSVVVNETRVPFCTGVPAPAVDVDVGVAAGVPVVPPVPADGADVTPFSLT